MNIPVYQDDNKPTERRCGLGIIGFRTKQREEPARLCLLLLNVKKRFEVRNREASEKDGFLFAARRFPEGIAQAFSRGINEAAGKKTLFAIGSSLIRTAETEAWYVISRKAAVWYHASACMIFRRLDTIQSRRTDYIHLPPARSPKNRACRGSWGLGKGANIT